MQPLCAWKHSNVTQKTGNNFNVLLSHCLHLSFLPCSYVIKINLDNQPFSQINCCQNFWREWKWNSKRRKRCSENHSTTNLSMQTLHCTDSGVLWPASDTQPVKLVLCSVRNKTTKHEKKYSLIDENVKIIILIFFNCLQNQEMLVRRSSLSSINCTFPHNSVWWFGELWQVSLWLGLQSQSDRFLFRCCPCWLVNTGDLITFSRFYPQL